MMSSRLASFTFKKTQGLGMYLSGTAFGHHVQAFGSYF